MTGAVRGTRRFAAVAAVAALTLAGCTSPTKPTAQESWPPTDGRGPCSVDKQTDVPATMRDGTVLRADVYRPTSSDALPVILMRTQYGKTGAQVQPSRYQTPDWFASHCYLVVVQDIRGTGNSSGTFEEYAHDRDDGYDSVEWAAALPGSNGKVGMYGSSYVGATQWLAAVTAPPHLVTIVPANTAADYYDGWTYQGGEFRLAFILPWAMGLAGTAAENRHDDATVAELKSARADIGRWLAFRPYDQLPPMHPGDPAVAPWYFQWIQHSTRDDFWKQFSIRDHYDSVRVPVLNMAGWYDAFLDGSIGNFAGMAAGAATPEARQHQRLVIGPWDHLAWGRTTSTPAPMLRNLGAVADSPVNELMLAWYDHFLKGTDNGVSTDPKVDYYLMGANRWKSARSWPLPETQWTRYYLGRERSLSTVAPVGSQDPDRYVYDPANPVPSLGGHSCCSAESGPIGPYDQTPTEQRSDVLVYSSDPLATDTEVTGPVTVNLWAASSAVDTDFTAKLLVVKPDGEAINLNNGILRAAFRDSLSDPRPIEPGKPYRYTIAIWPTSYLFAAGDRIRVEISSSDYPQFAPNPNTGAPFGRDAEMRPATQTILHDAEHPSDIVIPVIPGSDRGSDRFPM